MALLYQFVSILNIILPQCLSFKADLRSKCHLSHIGLHLVFFLFLTHASLHALKAGDRRVTGANPQVRLAYLRMEGSCLSGSHALLKNTATNQHLCYRQLS